MFVYIIKVLML